MCFERHPQEPANRRFVFDDENAPCAHARLNLARAYRNGRHDGQPDQDPGPAAVVARGADLDMAAMGIDDPLADGEAEAGPGRLPVAGPDAVEHIEDILPIGRWNAWPLIADHKRQTAGRGFPGDGDGAAGGSVLCGIVEHIGDNLLERSEEHTSELQSLTRS